MFQFQKKILMIILVIFSFSSFVFGADKSRMKKDYNRAPHIDSPRMLLEHIEEMEKGCHFLSFSPESKENKVDKILLGVISAVKSGEYEDRQTCPVIFITKKYPKEIKYYAKVLFDGYEDLQKKDYITYKDLHEMTQEWIENTSQRKKGRLEGIRRERNRIGIKTGTMCGDYYYPDNEKSCPERIRFKSECGGKKLICLLAMKKPKISLLNSKVHEEMVFRFWKNTDIDFTEMFSNHFEYLLQKSKESRRRTEVEPSAPLKLGYEDVPLSASEYEFNPDDD